MIFDFDGVMVYTSQSFRKAIRKVVDHYFLNILGFKGESGKLINFEDIQKFKDIGLYNNDWVLSYGAITYYLSIIIRKMQGNVLQNIRERLDDSQFSKLSSFLEVLQDIGCLFRNQGIKISKLVKLKNDDTWGLTRFLALIKEQGDPLEAPFLSDCYSNNNLIRKMIPYSLDGPDLLKRLFEEIYLGKELYSRFYAQSSIFKFDESLLENEILIPNEETLDFLYQKYGKLQIYSERVRVQGIYVIEKNHLNDYFDLERSVFVDDLIVFGKNYECPNFGKPNPAPFIKHIEKHIDKHQLLAYVGDSIADALLIKNVRMKGVKNVLFFGVLSSSHDPDLLISKFIEYGANAIMTDINDIPYLLSR